MVASAAILTVVDGCDVVVWTSVLLDVRPLDTATLTVEALPLLLLPLETM